MPAFVQTLNGLSRMWLSPLRVDYQRLASGISVDSRDYQITNHPLLVEPLAQLDARVVFPLPGSAR